MQLKTASSPGQVNVASMGLTFELANLHPLKSGCTVNRDFDFEGDERGKSFDECVYQELFDEEVGNKQLMIYSIFYNGLGSLFFCYVGV